MPHHSQPARQKVQPKKVKSARPAKRIKRQIKNREDDEDPWSDVLYDSEDTESVYNPEQYQTRWKEEEDGDVIVEDTSDPGLDVDVVLQDISDFEDPLEEMDLTQNLAGDRVEDDNNSILDDRSDIEDDFRQMTMDEEGDEDQGEMLKRLLAQHEARQKQEIVDSQESGKTESQVEARMDTEDIRW